MRQKELEKEKKTVLTHLDVLSECGEDPAVDALRGPFEQLVLRHKALGNGQLRKANNVPELVAKVAIAEHRAHVEVDAAALRRVVAQRKAHRVRAALRNAL